MLQFPAAYFQEETRCGFTVSETMKRFWAAQMEVLQTIIAICDRYDLTYYAFYGTLLGAVRHKGFIPWDDDIDLVMKREDYQIFLQVAERELPVGWHVRSMYHEMEWGQYHAVVCNELRVDISEERLSRFHGCPFVAGVDIFSLDYVPRDPQEAVGQKLLLSMIHATVSSVKYLHTAMEDATKEQIQQTRAVVEEGLTELEEVCKVSIDREGSVKNQLFRLYDRVCALYGEQEADVLTFFPDYVKGIDFFPRKEWLGITQLPFENMILTAPCDYDKILRAYYGDYSIYQRNMQVHEYPIYKRELELLHEKGVWLDVKE